MKHKGLIALLRSLRWDVLTTFTSQILGVKEPVGTVMITNEADTEGVPMAGRAAAQAAIDEDPASQGQKTAAEEAGVAVYGLDAGRRWSVSSRWRGLRWHHVQEDGTG